MSCIPGAPIIVAKQSYVAQTASLPPTTLYTAPEEGDYRVDQYLTNTDFTASGGDSSTTLTWNDGVHALSGTFCDAGVGWKSSTTVLHLAAGQSISLSCYFYSPSSTQTYNLYITVVKE